jgi:hypothetical protein
LRRRERLARGRSTVRAGHEGGRLAVEQFDRGGAALDEQGEQAVDLRHRRPLGQAEAEAGCLRRRTHDGGRRHARVAPRGLL